MMFNKYKRFSVEYTQYIHGRILKIITDNETNEQYLWSIGLFGSGLTKLSDKNINKNKGADAK